MTSAVVGIDPAAIAGWMQQLGIAFTGPLSFERIGLGQSNLTYLMRDANDRKWVLCRPPLGDLSTSAHDVAREARILSGEGVMRLAMDEPQNKAAAGTPAAHWIDALVHKARDAAEDAGI